MSSEIEVLEACGTWALTMLPKGKILIGCKWVYKIKYHSDGTIDQYKTWLITKGYNQVEGMDITQSICFGGQTCYYSLSFGCCCSKKFVSPSTRCS